MSTNIDMNSLDNSNIKDLAFKEWLAGLIDGDGYFILTKNGYNSCEITMDARDKKVLYLIQHKYGGTVKQISNALAFKYKLRNRAGLIALINDVNGLIRNPTRLLQMNKLCVKFSLELKYPDNLTFNNGWFSGFIDSDGSVYYSESSGQVFIGISQKNKYLLEPLITYFNDYPLRGNNYKGFLDWVKLYYMMLSKEHLTELGIGKIKTFSLNMNSKKQFTK